MTKRILSMILTVAMLLSCLPVSVLAAEPARQVSGAGELAAAVSENADIVLTGDVDLSEWQTADAYTGHLDGNGHTVSGLKQAMFHQISGTVENLTVADAYIERKADSERTTNVGALADANLGTVRNVHLTDSGMYGPGDGFTGGLIGYNAGEILQCSNRGGEAPTGAPIDSWKGTRKIQGDGAVGGVVGFNDGGVVNECYNVDAVSSATGGHGQGYAGGVVGMNGNLGTVTNCYNRGDISNGTVNSGGIIGRNKDVNNVEGFCTNSYHNGTVRGGNNDRVMTTFGFIDNGHYMERELSGHPDNKNPETPHTVEDIYLANGLNKVSDFFTVENGKLQLLWETGKQPQQPTLANKAAIAAKLDEVKNLSQEDGPYTDNSWIDFLLARENASFANGYLYTEQEIVDKYLGLLETAHANLKVNHPDPEVPEIVFDHQAGTADELKTALKAGGNIQLTADITLPESWNPGFLMNIFLLDGAGHTITLSGTNLLDDGMMNEVGSGCTVQNLVLTGTASGRGAVASDNRGTIRNCVNRASVTGENAGGFVGTNWSKILYSVNYGTVTGADSGSIAGKLQDRDGVAVTGCYGVGEKLLGQGTADETNALLTSATDLEAAAEMLNAQVTANDIGWKVENGVLALTTETIGGSGPVDPDPETPDPELTVVEISNAEEFYGALSNLIFDEGMTEQEGKKLVLTADITLSGSPMPMGLNTILDGQGHTINLDKVVMVDKIGPKGEIRNLGVTGSAEGTSTGAMTINNYGKIVNCWSTAIVNNSSASTVGGLVGVLREGGSIENTFVAATAHKGANVGGLVGTVRPGSTIKNSYWLSGAGNNAYFRALDEYNMPIEYTGCENVLSKTAEEFKAPAFLEELNANRGSNMQWNRSENGMPYFGEHVADLEIVEIADKDQFYAALADLIMDETMSNQEGRKLVITADFSIPYESFRMPKGLNTILDGQGHTITLEKMSLVDEIGPKGEIRNLGLVGSAEEAATGAFAPKSAGKIVNCWSTAIVNHNADSTIGALVGQLLPGASIENCYAGAPVLKAKKIGGLVGTAREGSTIKNSYWMAGTAEKAYFRALDDYDMPVDYTGAIDCAAKTDAEFKSAAFLELLNANRGSNAKWTTGSNGYPQFVEGSSVNPGQGVEITLTLTTGKVITFNSASGLVVDPLDTLGRNNIGTLSCEGGVYWGIDYDLYGKNIMIGMESGDLYVYGPGSVLATVSGADGKAIASFNITATEQLDVFDIRLTTEQGELKDGVVTVPGSTTVSVQPQIQEEEGGEWISVHPMYFTFTVSPEGTQIVNNSITAVKPGTYVITATGLGQTAELTLVSEYAPITSIRPSPNGEYIIHERHAMVFEKYADFLDLNLSHGAGSVIIEPSYATNQGKDAFEFTFSDPAVADYVPDFVLGIRPLRAGTTDITATTLKEEHNVSGTTTITLKYRNPLVSIEMPANITVKAGEKIELPMVLTGSNPTAADPHVSEPAMDWSFSSTDGGKVSISRTGMGIEIIEEGQQPYYVANDQYMIEGVSGGTVTVTGTPWDTTNGVEPVTFTVTVTGDSDVPAIDYVQMAKDDIAEAADWIITVKDGTYLYPDEWKIFSLLRSGYTLEEARIDAEAYFQSVKETYSEVPMKNKLKKPTEMARVTLGLTVLGADASDFRGLNFIELMTNSKNIMDGSNEAIWVLIALDTVGYEIPEGAVWTREKLIDAILTFECEDGGFGLFSGNTLDVDMTGMALQALTPYYHQGSDKIDAAVDRALDRLRRTLNEDCGYGTPEAAAQVLTALTSLGIDPLDEANGFAMGRKNLITYIDSFQNEDGGFKHIMNMGTNDMATEQCLYALESFMRFHQNENRLYDFSDVNDQPQKPGFEDVPDTYWAKEDIDFVTGRGLFGGTSATTFEPKSTMTRAMFVTVLGRLAGVDAAAAAVSGFEDVQDGQWFAPYVAWAVENGIANGMTPTTFEPYRSITREEMAVMLDRYCQKAGIALDGDASVSYDDAAQISSWAKASVERMTRAGILNGKGVSTFAPKAPSTRAEAAAVLARLMKIADL